MGINYGMAIQHLFPGAQPGVDYEVIDHGFGPHITLWRLPTLPTEAEFTKAARDAQALIDQGREWDRNADEFLKTQPGRDLLDEVTRLKAILSQERQEQLDVQEGKPGRRSDANTR